MKILVMLRHGRKAGQRGWQGCPDGRTAACRRFPPGLIPFLILLAACSGPGSTAMPAPARTVHPSASPSPTQTQTATLTATPTRTPLPTHTIAPTQTPFPTPSPTADPYWIYTIDYLASREYGGGELEVVEVLAQGSFTRYLIRYPSDGLWIYGFMNVPGGDGPFPVVIALHGYIDPSIYQTLDYTTGYADALARAGYLVVHPNLRNYAPSDTGDNLYRVGMAIDILNLIAILQTQSGTGPLEQADPSRLGMWGHSMGGGITTRVITVSDSVQAAVLYGAMSGDEQRNFEAIMRWSEGQRGHEELATPADQFTRISPIFHLDRIQAAVSIHHGRGDALVPLAWSIDTCDRLTRLGKTVECFYYEGMPHTFWGDGDLLFIQNTVRFFDGILKPVE